MTVHRGVPIEAAVKCWVEFSRRLQIVVAGHVVCNLVAVLSVNAVHGEAREDLRIALLSLGFARKREAGRQEETKGGNDFYG